MNINKNYAVRIYDGEYTRVYTTNEISALAAKRKIVNFHKAIGYSVVKVTVTKIKS